MENFRIPYKDIEVIMVIYVLAKHYLKHQKEIVKYHPGFDQPFMTDLVARANKAQEEIVGINRSVIQQEATLKVKEKMAEAKKKTRIFKTIIETMFENDPAQVKLLKNIFGINEHYEAAAAGDQESMVALLSHFVPDLAPQIKQMLVDKKVSFDLIAELKGLAEAVKEADSSQDTLKLETPEMIHHDREEIYQLFRQAMGLCKIGQEIFSDEKEIKAKFTYGKLAAGLRKVAKKSKKGKDGGKAGDDKPVDPTKPDNEADGPKDQQLPPNEDGNDGNGQTPSVDDQTGDTPETPDAP